MALKIKKQIKQPDGTILEIEGTEAEVEAFEKKQEKRQQSEQAKKERKLLLDSKKTLDKMTKSDLTKLIQELLAKLQPSTTHIYWHFDNGYWWRPWWENGRWIYQTTTSNPYITYTSNNTSLCNQSYTICNSVEDLQKVTNIGYGSIISSLSGPNSAPGLVTTGTVSGGSITMAGSQPLSSGNYSLNSGKISAIGQLNLSSISSNTLKS